MMDSLNLWKDIILKGTMAQKIKLGKGVNVSKTGSTFNINKTIDTKKTAASIEVSNSR